MIASAERITIARSEYQALDSYLQGLPPEGWARASACEGWQVRDVVAHLIGTTDFQAAMIQRALKGEPEPPSDVKGTTVRSRSEAIARQAIGLRERLTPDLLTPFAEHYRRLFDLLDSLGPEDLKMPAYHPIGPGSRVRVETYIDLVILETALHGWDIRVAASPSASITPECTPVLMEYVPSWLTRILHPETGKDAAYCFRFRGPGLEARDLVIEEDGFRIEPPGPSTPTATLETDVDTYILLHFGRLTFGQARDMGRLSVDGDVDSVARVDAWMLRV